MDGVRLISLLAAARLIVEQKVTVKYAGTTIQPDNTKLPDMLRKKSEVGKTSISKETGRFCCRNEEPENSCVNTLR